MKKELKHKVKDLESAKANQVFQKLQLDIKSLRKNPESTWKNEQNLLKEQNYVK